MMSGKRASSLPASAGAYTVQVSGPLGSLGIGGAIPKPFIAAVMGVRTPVRSKSDETYSITFYTKK